MPSAAAASVGEDDDEDDEGKEGDDENSKSDEKEDAVFGGFEESRVEAAPEAKAEAAPNPTAAAATNQLDQPTPETKGIRKHGSVTQRHQPTQSQRKSSFQWSEMKSAARDVASSLGP